MPEAATFLPVEIAPDTVESLYAEHGPERHWTYWLVLAGCLSALAALPLVHVDVTVRAPGMIRPARERADLKVAVSGRIARVLVRENEHVQIGQALVELVTRDVDERLSHNLALQTEKSDLISDLRAVLEAIPTTPADTHGTTPPGENREPIPPISMADNSSVHAARTLSPQSAMDQSSKSEEPTNLPDRYLAAALPTFRTNILRSEVSQLQAQLAVNRQAMLRASAELARASTLATRGLITRQELENSTYEVERLRGEAQLQVEQAAARWQSRLRDEQTTLDQLASERKRLEEERTLSVLRAPVSGAVQGLTGLAEGATVISGQLLGQVSPDEQLKVEAHVSTRDVGLIRIGQPVRLQVDAYPYTEWGLLDGLVEEISADALSNGSQSYFKVLVRPAADHLTLRGQLRGDLRKGMTLTARFFTAQRSLLQILTESASDWLDPRSNSSS